MSSSKRELLLSKISNQSLETDISDSNEVNQQYEAKLKADIKAKSRILKNFKTHELPSLKSSSSSNEPNSQAKIDHLMSALGKLSYFPERRDTIGVSLALSNLSKEISELEETVEALGVKAKHNTDTYQEIFDLNSSYKFILQTLQRQEEELLSKDSDKEEDESSDDDVTGKIKRRIEAEKRRNKQLKKDLIFVQDYVKEF